MLKYRIITALILIPLTLAVLFLLPPLAFFIMSTLLIFGCAWEWSRLMGLEAKIARVIYLLFMLSGMIWASFFVPMKIIFIAAFVWWILATVLVLLYPRLSECWGRGVFWRGLMGFMVLIPCWGAINALRNFPHGAYTVLFLFVLIWGADTAAYFVGKKWGSTKLAPLVSPGKSRQGFFGAILFTTLIALIALSIAHIPLAVWPFALLLSLVTVLFSVVGDLFESMMKRQIGLKDSGSLLPGHGGLLDRIDSLTAAAPIFVLGGLMLGKYLQ